MDFKSSERLAHGVAQAGTADDPIVPDPVERADPVPGMTEPAAPQPGGSPVGLIIAYMGTPDSGVPLQAPSYGSTWFLCDGHSLAINDYPALQNLLQDHFGVSQDPSRFLLPDLRGYFVRVLDLQTDDPGTASGRDPGLQTRQSQSAAPSPAYIGSLQPQSAGPHTHQLTGYVQAAGFQPFTLFLGDFPNTDPYFKLDSPSTGSDTRPKNVCFCFIICARSGGGAETW